MKNNYPKIGIALGSGGAKGLAHIGVLKALQFHGIPISYIAGSSIGAIIGAYYAANPDIKKLEEFIINFNARQVFALFDPALGGGFIKGKKIEIFISELLGATFETLKIPYAAVATDFTTAEEVVLQEGDLIKAIRASISIPAIFQPIEYQDKLLADGGLSNPVPDDTVKKMGSEIVIAVNLDQVYTPELTLKTPPLAKIPLRAIDILRHNLALYSLRTADIVITPKLPEVGLVGWNYFFNTEKAQKLIKAGEDATEEILPQLRKIIKEKQENQRGMKKFFSFFKLNS